MTTERGTTMRAMQRKVVSLVTDNWRLLSFYNPVFKYGEYISNLLFMLKLMQVYFIEVGPVA